MDTNAKAIQATLQRATPQMRRILADQLRQFIGKPLSALDSQSAIELGERADHMLREMGFEVPNEYV